MQQCLAMSPTIPCHLSLPYQQTWPWHATETNIMLLGHHDVACSNCCCQGPDGELPWHIPGESSFWSFYGGEVYGNGKHTISKISGRNVNFSFFSIVEKDRKGKRYPSKVTLPNCRSKPSHQHEDSAWKLCIAKRVAKRHRHVETDNLTLQSQWFLLEWFPKEDTRYIQDLALTHKGKEQTPIDNRLSI